MSSNWYRPPPGPLDLPEPTYPDRPRSFPDHPAPDLFPLQLPVHQHSPASPALSLPDSPAPPLRGLATKFAQMMGRGASPVPSPSSSSGWRGATEGRDHQLDPPSAPVRPGHGYSKSLGQPVSPYWEQQPDDALLSGDEIERLAREEREWSRREAERLMALENQRLAGGALGLRQQVASPDVERDERTPRKLVSRPNSYYDASSTPPTATRSATAPVHSTAPVDAPIPAPPTRLQTESLPALPSQKSPYLLPHAADPDALDVPSSLVLLARKFEKLELYSVTHLRALASRMGDLEDRVKELGAREGVVQVRKEMRELKGAMADGFRALEGEIEGLGRKARDGFGLGVGTVEHDARQAPERMSEESDTLPGLSSSASSTSSHHRSLKTPSPGLSSAAFPVDTTPLAVNKPASASLDAPAQSTSGRLSPSPSSSPVPPRKRYTHLLSSRSPSTESTTHSVSPSPDASPSANHSLAVPPAAQAQSQSTPLPSAPFPPARAQTASLLPSPTRPLFLKSRSPSTLDEGLDSPTRRRARSVGSTLSGGQAGADDDVARHKKVLGDDVKANNRGRAPVNKLISAWERK